MTKQYKSEALAAAHYLNVTMGLVSQWERGEKRPRGASLKLLTLVAKNGLGAVARGSIAYRPKKAADDGQRDWSSADTLTPYSSALHVSRSSIKTGLKHDSCGPLQWPLEKRARLAGAASNPVL